MPAVTSRYKYLDALTTAFVVILLVSNLVAQKICVIGPLGLGKWALGPFDVSGAVLLFPITYIFGDVFTEVYGFAASRRAIWLGVLRHHPALSHWQHRHRFARRARLAEPAGLYYCLRIHSPDTHCQSHRILAGEFANSYTMARLSFSPMVAPSGPAPLALLSSVRPSIPFWSSPSPSGESTLPIH